MISSNLALNGMIVMVIAYTWNLAKPQSIGKSININNEVIFLCERRCSYFLKFTAQVKRFLGNSSRVFLHRAHFAIGVILSSLSFCSKNRRLATLIQPYFTWQGKCNVTNYFFCGSFLTVNMASCISKQTMNTQVL